MSIPTDTNVNQTWNLTFSVRPDGKGAVNLPPDLWRLLLHRSGIKSKRYRIQKKAVRREFNSLLSGYLDEKIGK